MPCPADSYRSNIKDSTCTPCTSNSEDCGGNSSGICAEDYGGDADVASGGDGCSLLPRKVGDDCSSNINVCFDTGQFCDVDNIVGKGAHKCQLAREGYFATGDGTQTACAAGYMTSTPGATDRSYCTMCTPGYDSRTGLGSGPELGCTECKSGTYGTLGIKCQLCPKGYFHPNMGATSNLDCDPAPSGKFVGSTGSESAEDCAAGTFSANKSSFECMECRIGGMSVAGASRCSSCPLGFSSFSGEGECHICPAGTSKGISSVVCEICQAGRYSGEGAASCTECPPGQVSFLAGATNCMVCPAGRYANYSKCPHCPAGKYSPEESSSCLKCEAGKISQDGASSCETCQAS